MLRSRPIGLKIDRTKTTIKFQLHALILDSILTGINGALLQPYSKKEEKREVLLYKDEYFGKLTRYILKPFRVAKKGKAKITFKAMSDKGRIRAFPTDLFSNIDIGINYGSIEND